MGNRSSKKNKKDKKQTVNEWGIYYDEDAKNPLIYMNEPYVWGRCKHEMYSFVNRKTKIKKLYLIWRQKYVYITVEKQTPNLILFTFMTSEVEHLFFNSYDKTSDSQVCKFYSMWELWKCNHPNCISQDLICSIKFKTKKSIS